MRRFIKVVNSSSLVNHSRKRKKDLFGVISANDVIKQLLIIEGGKTFGEIKKHLKANGFEYTQRGFDKRLKSLIKEGILEKKDQSDSYPKYFLKIRGSDHSIDGWWLKYSIYTLLFENILLGKDTHHKLNALISIIGVYTIFTEIQSLKMMSEKNSYLKNYEIRKSFLKNALPLVSAASAHLINFDDPGEFIPGLYKDKKYRNEIINFEKFLKKNFPVEMKICNRAYSVSSDATKILKKR